jgi:hypothetical protein|tara:strand:- start:615 stop:761 length:147 start_codon:yes stop_codon:yes gene_type:complete
MSGANLRPLALTQNSSVALSLAFIALVPRAMAAATAPPNVTLVLGKQR